MAQILNMHTQTRPNDLFLLASSKNNTDLSLLKKNWSTTYRSKRSNINIACSVGRYTTSTTQPEIIRVDPAKLDIRRSQFPPNFKFGTATAAYQIEGAWNEGGKGPSICDEFFHNFPHKVTDGKNGDDATDSYNRYKEDVQLMKKMGVNSYRFSISWSRILPDGTLKGGRNREGVMYYNNLINELIENGITPFVTLFHWDVPLALDEKYGGFRDKKIKDDFKDYCQICFQEFGDRVKHWATLNEPWSFATLGYGLGMIAPGRCSPSIKDLGCPVGDSMTEPYTVTHNLLLAHATAVQLYRNHFQSIQGGEIGIVLNCTWYKPYSDSVEDKDAKDRQLEFMLGWYMEPLINGEYPYIMRKMVGKRLPEFSPDDSEMLKGSFDFLGLNYYTTKYAKNIPKESNFTPSISVHDSYVEESVVDKDNLPIGPNDGSWVYMVPDGLRDLLDYTRSKYHDPKIYIMENGTCQVDDPKHKLPIEKAISDDHRTEYMILHLKELQYAINDGAKIEGYFVWSLLDNFEWKDGYTFRFGLHYVDYNDDLARTPKKSSSWYTKFLHS